MAVWDSAELKMRPRRGHAWLASALSALDERLRRQQAVFEYTHNPACVFRLDICRTIEPVALCDGTCIRPGDRMARLHFWNEHIPAIPRSGATIGWARQLNRGIAASLRELVEFLATRPELADVTAVYAEVSSGANAKSDQIARIMSHYGFEAKPAPTHLPFNERLHRFGENILISLLVLAHNPRALHFDTLARVRVPIYLPRQRLEKEFGRGDCLFRA
jgi:hypothetical protein